MTIAEQMHQEGHAAGLEKGLETGLEKGLEEGLEKGREEGRVALARTLATLLTLKFGELDEASRTRIDAASSEFLEAWSQRVLFAKTVASVLAE